MRRLSTQSGGLDVIILEPEGSVRADINVVFSHGFGAPGDDLVALGSELVDLAPALASRVRWIFPRAPLSLEELGYPSGRAWWHLDLERFVQGRDWARYVEEVPEGLPRARRMYLAMLEDLGAKTQVPLAKTFLGGFSQGAMLSTDVALRLEEAPAGLIVLSGTLLSRAAWGERASKRSALHVFQSHGRRDPLLPYEVAERLRHLFEDAQMKVRFLGFDGEHTIPLSVLKDLGTWLADRIAAI